jgi:hypothetical protein
MELPILFTGFFLLDIFFLFYFKALFVSFLYIYFIHKYIKDTLSYNFIFVLYPLYFFATLIQIPLKKLLFTLYIIYMLNYNKQYYIHSPLMIFLIALLVYFFIFYNYLFFNFKSIMITVGAFVCCLFLMISE